MKVHFTLNYQTTPGQQVYITGNTPELGNNDWMRAVPMGYKNAQQWDVVLDIKQPNKKVGFFTYNYFVIQADGTKHFEGGTPKLCGFSEVPVAVFDTWTDPSWKATIFEAKPFKEVFFKRPTDPEVPQPLAFVPGQVVFQVSWPFLEPHHRVCLMGSAPKLGKWQVEQPLLLEAIGAGKFSAVVDFAPTDFPLSYKYGLFDVKQGAFLGFESGDNRMIFQKPEANTAQLQNDSFLRLPTPAWKGAGVAVPIFSLRTNNGLGVGEFLDLMPLVDWASEVGLKLIQILPVNDTTATHTWTDSYPYAAISAFALHPMYLNHAEVAKFTGVRMPKSWTETYTAQKDLLNQLPAVDYEQVNQTKMQLLGVLFDKAASKTATTVGYKKFVKENKDWLEAYAAFCYFRDFYGTAEFAKWPAHQTYLPKALKKFAAAHPDFQEAVDRVCFVQYHLHRQLQTAHAYALEKGVIFKGDVPIGIYRHSADAWQQPDLYHMDRQAGAPPDDFAVKGQNWGFPTYNWPRMAADGFSWWQRRFVQMRNYYDAFRIDHILGFFRIWSIPMHAVEGIMGYFEPALPITQEELLMRGLPLDMDRFTKPYTDFLYLKQLFGENATTVAHQFFDTPENGLYPLKPEFATQQQVAHFFDALEDTAHHRATRLGLMDVISNVLLFEVPTSAGPVYHCRFHLERTHSFKSLPVWQQTRMRDLYNNYFFERQDEMWQTEALQKLPALKFATDMLVCGEDLGLVPACVPDVMHRTGLLSLEVQRMPKNPGVPFLDLSAIPYLSVATPASHDTSTIRGWWEEPETDRATFYKTYLHLEGTAPEHATDALVEAVIVQHLQSPAMWAIFQLQDWVGMDEALRYPDVESERINVPANPKHYWRYRFHANIENLRKNQEFSILVREILNDSKRA